MNPGDGGCSEPRSCHCTLARVTRMKLCLKKEEGRNSEIKDEVSKLTQSDKVKEKRIRKYGQSFQNVWNYVKQPNLRIIGVLEEEEKSKIWKTYLGE